MTDPGAPDGLDDLIDQDAAAALLEVPPAQLEAMVEQGMLTPQDAHGSPRFLRAEVLAARELGG